jgi:hypothetical protein
MTVLALPALRIRRRCGCLSYCLYVDTPILWASRCPLRGSRRPSRPTRAEGLPACCRGSTPHSPAVHLLASTSSGHPGWLATFEHQLRQRLSRRPLEKQRGTLSAASTTCLHTNQRGQALLSATSSPWNCLLRSVYGCTHDGGAPGSAGAEVSDRTCLTRSTILFASSARR